jgi:hypothetical protein
MALHNLPKEFEALKNFLARRSDPRMWLQIPLDRAEGLPL